MSRPAFFHDFLYTYGTEVGIVKQTELTVTMEGVEKVMDNFYKMVEYRKVLEEIAPMCGNPDAVDDCRLIHNKCQEELKDA